MSHDGRAAKDETMPDHKPDIDKKPTAGGHNGALGRGERLASGIEANPLVLVAGGLALGIVAGALLPRSARERDLLSPVGAKVGGALTAALAAAREAGQAELDELGLNREAARGQVKTLVEGLLHAASTAGAAAAQAATGKVAD